MKRLLRVLRFPASWTGEKVLEHLYWPKRWQVLDIDAEEGFLIATWTKEEYLHHLEKAEGEYILEKIPGHQIDHDRWLIAGQEIQGDYEG